MNRRITANRAAALGLALWVWAAPATTHPGLDLQIADLNARIEQTPDDAVLFLRRGELHRLHREWALAEADYQRSMTLDPELDAARLSLGKLKLESGDPAAARRLMDRYLRKQPEDSRARVVRARALHQLGRHMKAAADFTVALDTYPGERPLPEFYIERARALEAAGEAHLDRAVAGLDEGLARLGQPITLANYAIELELKRGNTAGALRRLDAIAADSIRKERWLLRKAEILEGAGRRAEAIQSYRGSLEAIATLPTSRRQTRAVHRLETQAREALARLEPAQAP